MVTQEDFFAELNKLNKTKLIEIIFNKRISDGVLVSEEIRNHINSGFESNTQDFSTEDTVNLENNVEFIKLKSELEITKVKLESENRAVSNLQTIIDHQKTIIQLQGVSMCNVNKPAVSVSAGGVAVTGDSSSVLGKVKQRRAKNLRSDVTVTVDSSLPFNDSESNNQKFDSDKPSQDNAILQPKDKNKVNKRTRAIGTDLSSAFRSAEGQAWFHVGKAGLGSTENDVLAHLQTKFPDGKFSVEMLPQNENATSRSFKVGTELNLLDEMYKGENWPKNISIRRFNFFRSRRNN